MFSLLRNRLGIPGLISVIALVFAMLGGAYAASDSGGGGASISAKKKGKAAKRGPRGPRGKRGKNGAPGPAGPVGPAGPGGPAGPQGAKGDSGTNGSNGTPGANGKGVVLGVENTGTGNCGGRGGATVEVEGVPATKKIVCNGEEGSPWAAGGTLPSGETLTGTFSIDGNYPANSDVEGSISFPIPLSSTDEAVISEFSLDPVTFELIFPNIHVLSPGEQETTECPGTPNAPAALPGNLCVYIAAVDDLKEQVGTQGEPFLLAGKPSGEPGVGQSGALLRGQTVATEELIKANGSWAVTAQ